MQVTSLKGILLFIPNLPRFFRPGKQASHSRFNLHLSLLPFLEIAFLQDCKSNQKQYAYP
jgi:hypothetical protein